MHSNEAKNETKIPLYHTLTVCVWCPKLACTQQPTWGGGISKTQTLKLQTAELENRDLKNIDLEYTKREAKAPHRAAPQ